MTATPPLEHSRIRGLKRTEFEQLVKQGAFDDERVELIFGQVVHMSPIDPAHVEAVSRIDTVLTMKLFGRAKIICQGATLPPRIPSLSRMSTSPRRARIGPSCRLARF